MSLLPKPQTLRVTPDILEELRLSSGTGQLFEIRPYVDSPQTIEDNIEMFKAFHEAQYSGWPLNRNKSPTNAFEMWFDGENIRLMMYIGDRYATKRAIRHVSSNFPSASVELPDEVSGTAFLNIEEDDHVAATDFKLKMHMYAPIRNPRGVEQWTEPYRNVIADMTDEREVREVIQILFKPVNPGWTSSFFNDVSTYADDWAEERTVERLGGLEQDESPAAEEALKAQSNIKSQLDQPGFYINIRVLTVSKNPHAAADQCKEISRSIRDYYREWTGQQPVPVHQTGYGIQRQLYDMVAREGKHMHWPYNPTTWRKRKKTGLYETLVMTIPELAGLAHIPNGTALNTEAIEWERLDSSNALPANAPKYDDYQVKPTDDEPEESDADDDSSTDPDDSDSPDDHPPTAPPIETHSDESPDSDTETPPSLDEPHETLPELNEGRSPEPEAEATLPTTDTSSELPTSEQSPEKPDVDTSEDDEDVPIASGPKPRSTNDVVKQSGEVWTKPEADDSDYNPAKDNRNFRTGYRDPDGTGDWTGGRARDDDLNGDFDKYVPPSERSSEPEPEPKPPSEEPAETEDDKDTLETPHVSAPDTTTEEPNTEKHEKSTPSHDQSDLEPWERGSEPEPEHKPEPDESAEEPDSSYNEPNQAAVEGIMENEGRPPEFKDERRRPKQTDIETSTAPPEPAESDEDTGSGNESGEHEDTVEQPPEGSDEPESDEDVDNESTDEAKESSNTQSINAVWASWDDTLTTDADDDSSEGADSDGSDTN
jgi:hypothetical protein